MVSNEESIMLGSKLYHCPMNLSRFQLLALSAIDAAPVAIYSQDRPLHSLHTGIIVNSL